MGKFLSVVPVSEAVGKVMAIAPPPEPEDVPLEEAAGRVLFADVRTDTDIPGFDRSVVDGYAVRAADTTGAGDAVPAMLRLKGRVGMGEAGTIRIAAGECAYVPTGGVLPCGADAMVMIEHAEEAGDLILIKKAAAHNENVLLHDEDFRKGAVVLSAGRLLSAQDIGVLAAAGCPYVTVAKRPVIGIVSTGNELVPVTTVPEPGQVRDANAPMAGAFVAERGCVPKYYGIIRDEKEAFDSVIIRAAGECDAVLLSGGSSKDDRDMTAGVIARHGEVLVHGIALAPGKPTIIGRIGETPVIGLPGHPASAFVVLFAIARHLMDRMIGNKNPLVRTVTATLAQNIPSQRGREDYVRVAVTGGEAVPVFGKSGLLNTLVKSSGVVRIPAESEGLEKGSAVEVILW
jgi:molybdopterin molybdotransferase